MPPYINLSRRFRDLSKEELAEPEILASLNDLDYLPSLEWPELLNHPRVLLLAEAGSGKTWEMKEQVKQLISDNKFAFFIPLESLTQDSLIDSLEAGTEASFNTWKSEGVSIAWFFLDAVDELKLKQGLFERALNRFAKGIDGSLHRIHVIVSCRPTDWQPNFDMATFQSKLPFIPSLSKSMATAEELFIAPLDKSKKNQQTKESNTKVEAVRSVALLPMSGRQVETLARGLGMKDPAAFINEINKQDAWIFARRPLDCSELIATWNSTGQLGNRCQQHEANVKIKLKDDPDRLDSGILSDDCARQGAEHLALALALTRNRTIRSPEQALDVDRAEGVFDSKDVLMNWSDEKRKTLLRRALFDPATYGRVRFHHRSVQEYLAARHLKNLRDKGMSVKVLLRLFFAERYGVPVAIPSMRVIAAWLALWEEPVRRELMAREPETLLSFGDPGSLPIATRAILLKSFVSAYREGGSRGLNIPIAEVKRLAHPDLATTVRECWGDGPTNDDVRELLLELIWQGAIGACADIAERSAWAEDYSPSHRAIAIWTVVACNRLDMARKIADSMLSEPKCWPDNIVRDVVTDLFPAIITADELVALVERTPEPKSSVSGFEWVLREIAATVGPGSEAGIQLRNLLADLVWRGRHNDLKWYQLTSQFDFASPALALLCERQLSVHTANLDNELIRACIIAIRFPGDGIDTSTLFKELKQHFDKGSALRERAFWTDFTIMEELTSSTNEQERFFVVTDKGVLDSLLESDRPWLEKVLFDYTEPKRRALALYVLFNLWIQRGRIQAEVDFLRETVMDDAYLCDQLQKWITPIEPDTELERLMFKNLESQRIYEEREKQRLEDWSVWRERLIAGPSTAFEPDNIDHTIYNLYRWLEANERGKNPSRIWNFNALEQLFSQDIAEQATIAFKAAWRTNPPPILWSQLPPDERGTRFFSWEYGICGLTAESETPGWAWKLSPEEALIAAAYASVELNGFSSWLGELVDAYPEEVDAILGEELTAELALGADEQYLPALQNLSYADGRVKKLLAPRCLTALMKRPSDVPDEVSGGYSAHQLEQLFRILKEVSEGQDRVSIASKCNERFAADSAGPLSVAWLKGLFGFDAEQGVLTLGSHLNSLAEPEQTERAIKIIAALFGDRDTSLLKIENPSNRLNALVRLVHLSYKFVCGEDDGQHDREFTSDTRDNAQTGRGFLLYMLLDMPGSDAYKAKLELAAVPLFEDFADRLRLLAREQAALDAEFEAYSYTDLNALVAHLELPPHDRDTLFEVMRSRLDDLTHDIMHHDFTNRRTLCSINEECEMQRTLALRFEGMAKGAYVVTREAEKANAKRTDIQLDAVRGNQKAVIEIKIAYKWSLNELESALRNQLIGQYLRHESSRAGCLLLTHHGKKQYWEHPKTRDHLNFDNIVSYLDDIAQEIERESSYQVRLVVHGLNLC